MDAIEGTFARFGTSDFLNADQGREVIAKLNEFRMRFLRMDERSIDGHSVCATIRLLSVSVAKLSLKDLSICEP
jgi:hypothetical protein